MKHFLRTLLSLALLSVATDALAQEPQTVTLGLRRVASGHEAHWLLDLSVAPHTVQSDDERWLVSVMFRGTLAIKGGFGL